MNRSLAVSGIQRPLWFEPTPRCARTSQDSVQDTPSSHPAPSTTSLEPSSPHPIRLLDTDVVHTHPNMATDVTVRRFNFLAVL